MATSLVFDKALAPGQPVHLVFGDDGGGGGGATLPASVAATLPGLGARITTGRRAPMVVAGALPGPGVAVHLVRAWPAAVAAALPGMGVHVQTRLVRPASLRVGLPAPGVHVSLVPAPSGKLVATLPGLGGALGLGRKRPATGGVRIPGIQVAVELGYIINTREPVIGGARGRVQDAARLSVPLVSRLQRGTTMPAATRGTSTWGDPLASVTTGHYQDATRQAQPTQARQQPAMPMPAAPVRGRWQDAIRTRNSTQGRMQDGTPVQSGARMRYQDADRTRRPWLRSGMQQGVQVVIAAASALQQGQFLPARLRVVEQDGMRPPPGRWPGRPIPPAWDPCYLPPNGLHVDLLFQEEWSGATGLVFVCERHGPVPGNPTYVIPLLEIYMSAHSIEAVMLPSLEPVALADVNVRGDEGEYGWSLTASGKVPLFDQLAPVGGVKARVRVTLDGTSWVFAVDPPSRTRRWGDHAVQITGRSVTSLLGEPAMASKSWTNASARTAQQLILDALQFTGVELDWNITDWLVPAGAWNHQGAPLSVATRIAEAVGAILQSHRTDERLQLLPRYPLMPWEWAAATPDVQMPLASVESDALQPILNPAYNGVYVVGVSHGPRAHVLRDGTLGELLAPMVTDPLITHVDAARQRGRAVLGTAGTMVLQPLELPVLTGASLPGFLQMNQLVEVIEPTVTWRGLVRSINISANAPTVRQSIVLERHL